MKRLRALMSILSLAALGGCSAAGSSHPASSPEAQRPHATIADAEADLTRAEAQLPTGPGFGAIGGQPATGAATQEQAPTKDAKPDAAAAPPPAPPKREGRAEDAKKLGDKESSGADGAPTPCQTACRAFTSMQRAADSVCRLAGDADERCVGAKKRVENAKARVAHCGCS